MIEKEKALLVTRSMIECEGSILDTRYATSHHKVAVKLKDHLIEINGGDIKFLKYLDEKIPLSASEHKQIYSVFCEELDKRRAKTSEKFDDLERLLNTEKSKKYS